MWQFILGLIVGNISGFIISAIFSLNKGDDQPEEIYQVQPEEKDVANE